MIGPTARLPIRRTAEPHTEPGMVLVAGGPVTVGVAGAVTLADFWMDKLEVTNREFKRFVDAGGYRDTTRWGEPFHDGRRLLTFNEAMSRFRDSTGRAGPAMWELGSYPEGQADFPVAGISWFEAAAYAQFAGKSLPTLYHWYRAAPASGGLRFNDPPEIQPANFTPQVKVPVLMINGRDDFQAPYESQRRLFELLGTPEEHKVHLALEGGHVPNDHRSVIRAVLISSTSISSR